MKILPLNFFIYTVGGVWRPIEWSSKGAKFLYKFFTFVTVIPLYFLMLTQFMDIVLIVDNMDDFATNSLMFMTIVGVCCKATVAVIRRDAIIDLVQILLKDPCRPRDEAEMAIQTKFDEFIRSCSIKYSLLATGSITSFTVRSILNVVQGHLPYRVWLPYDSDKSLMFWITSIHQIITLIFATIINVGTETLIFGLFLQTCVQLEIFECRLHKLVTSKTARYRQHFSSIAQDKEEAALSEYIKHHLEIYKYAKTLNSIFNQVLFFQFFGSILVLCTSVYYMSTHATGSEAATLPAYTICMFVQIFVYCWSGNEVILKYYRKPWSELLEPLNKFSVWTWKNLFEGASRKIFFRISEVLVAVLHNTGRVLQEVIMVENNVTILIKKLFYLEHLPLSASIGSTIYNMNWPMLSVGEKRDLLMIMKRSAIPIKFTSSFLITFSLESYSNILKTSYSAFNVLTQS